MAVAAADDASPAVAIAVLATVMPTRTPFITASETWTSPVPADAKPPPTRQEIDSAIWMPAMMPCASASHAAFDHSGWSFLMLSEIALTILSVTPVS